MTDNQAKFMGIFSACNMKTYWAMDYCVFRHRISENVLQYWSAISGSWWLSGHSLETVEKHGTEITEEDVKRLGIPV